MSQAPAEQRQIERRGSLRPFTGFREWQLSLAACGCFFLIIASYNLLKPVRTSMVIATWGIRDLPLADVLSFGVMCALSHLYAALAKKLVPVRLVAAILAAGSMVLLLMLLCERYPGKVSSLLLYSFGSIVNLYAVMGFWSLTNAAHGRVAGMRRYGLIGAAGPAGGIAGAFAVNTIENLCSSSGLIVLSSLTLALAVPMAYLIRRNAVADDWSGSLCRASSSPLVDARVITRSRTATLILCLVLVMTISSSISDWVLTRLASARDPHRSSVVAMLSTAYMHLGVVSLAMQLILTTLLLRYASLRYSLLMLPCVAVLSSCLFSFNAAEPVMLGAAVVYMATFYTVNQSAKELLYTEHSPDIMYKAKNFIDTTFFRLGAMVGSSCVWLLVRYLGWDVPQLGLVLASLSCVWIFVVVVITRPSPLAASRHCISP